MMSPRKSLPFAARVWNHIAPISRFLPPTKREPNLMIWIWFRLHWACNWWASSSVGAHVLQPHTRTSPKHSKIWCQRWTDRKSVKQKRQHAKLNSKLIMNSICSHKIDELKLCVPWQAIRRTLADRIAIFYFFQFAFCRSTSWLKFRHLRLSCCFRFATISMSLRVPVTCTEICIWAFGTAFRTQNSIKWSKNTFSNSYM